MVEEAAFPRGRVQIPRELKEDRSKPSKKKKERDVLFGDTVERSSKKKKQEQKIQPTTTTKSLLPVGGGACDLKHNFIEPLTFNNMSKHMKVLGVVREILDNGVVVFSLPNSWSGYFFNTDDYVFETNQVLNVKLTKLVSEPTKTGVKRRIEVSVHPDHINNTVNVEQLFVRGIVQSIEDHGYLIDLGLNRKGFLHFDDCDSNKELKTKSVVDLVVKEASDSILKLQMPNKVSKKHTQRPPSIHELSPGLFLDNVVVEHVFSNGLGVSFGGYRAAIEDVHVPKVFEYYRKHPTVSCRVLAVDPTTKLIRLTMLPHLVENLEAAKFPVNVGDTVESAKVVRLDAGLGALFELPNVTAGIDKMLVEGVDEDVLNEETAKHYSYVHISNAMNDSDTPDHVFNKKFAVNSEHAVRIIKTTNLLEGVMVGGTASNIIDAHVLSYEDLHPGELFKQVPIVANLSNGNCLVDFGMNVKGLLPSTHLFDQVTTADYRGKIQKVKYAVGSKIDVRVFQVEAEQRKCLVTAKRSLVKASSESILTSYEQAQVGKVYHGFISSVNEQGVGVTFFNKVFGLVSAKSLAVDMGVENIQETYKVGDAVSCRVVHIKKKSIRKKRYEDEDEVQDDSLFKSYYELFLSLKVDGDAMETDLADAEVRLKMGAVLPLKSLRVMELVKGKAKKTAYVPGYSIVRIKTKYLVEKVIDSMPEFIDCKLPYDHLLDSYEPEDIATVSDLDKFAESMLTVGRKINRKGLVWKDPKKSTFEYKSGTGKLPVVSIKEGLVEVSEEQTATDAEDSEATIQLSGPDSHYYVGLQLRGTVGALDPRHGAFVRFLDGMSGLVPKRMGGMHLKLFSTVTVRVEAVDDKLRPPKILLGIPKRSPKSTSVNKRSSEMPSVGDTVPEAIVDSIDLYRAYLKVHDEVWRKLDVSLRLHCSMAKSQKRKSDDGGNEIDIKDGIPPSHPFFGLSKGSSLSGLRVVAVNFQGSSTYVDLTNIEDPVSFIQDESTLSPGDKVHGMVSASSDRGILLQISPFVKAHIPALEVSRDLTVLNNINLHFPIGRRLQCVVKHQKMPSKDKRSPRKWEKATEMLNLSLLDPNKKVKRPKPGDVVVGRIDRVKAHVSASDLGLDLRGGFTATSCITELADKEKWTNYPLGEPSDKRSDVDTSRSSDFGFRHGKFVRCKVLSVSDKAVEVSLRPSRLEGDDSDDKQPEVGESVQAYVVETNKKGCFLRISRQIAGRTKLKELSDHYLPNPAEIFRKGRLVVGKITEIHQSKSPGTKLLVDVDMRGSKVVDASSSRLKFEDVEIGNKYKATVTKVEEYGVFVRLHNSDVSGLVHKSECSDKFVKNPSDLYGVDDIVKVLVLKKDDAKRQVGFSMKASHFEAGDESDDESSEDETPIRESFSAEDQMEGDEIEHSDDENFGAKLAARMSENTSSSSDDSTVDSSERDSDASGDDTQSSTSDDDDQDVAATVGLDTNVGFDWNGRSLPKVTQEEASSEDSDSSDDDDEEDKHKSSHKSRKKQAKRRQEEQEIARRETALADGTADENPETAADFERLLAGEPSSSEIWIRFMAFHLGLANVSAAREVANRAFSRIEFREEEERLNVWCALLTLEQKYGTDDTLQQTLDKACQHNNPKKVYLRMCEIMEKHSENTTPESQMKTDEMFAKMCKKFKSKKKVWIANMEYLLKNGRHDDAYDLSKRCLLSLKPHKHVETMSKFAQLMFQYGNAEKARTIFEGLLAKYQKRLDLLFVYTDMEVKFGEVEVARSLYQKVANANDDTLKMKLTDQKMKSFFKKWFAFEETHGSRENQNSVKASATAYVERTTS